MLVVGGLCLGIGCPVYMPRRVGLGCGGVGFGCWGFGGEAPIKNGCAVGAPFVSFLGLSTYPQESIITIKILSKPFLLLAHGDT